LSEAIADEASAEGFELLARACRWLNDEAATLDADERAFGLFERAGERAAAARMAIWLALDLLDFSGQSAIANGWLQRAHRLLDARPLAPEHGLLAAVEAYLRLMLHNDGPGAIALADRAVEVASEQGPIDVEMVARAVKGLALVTMGEIERGMSLLDEASTAALGEEIEDPTVRSTILCALMDGCDRVRDFDRASQWCARIRDAAERWELPAVITACRPHYAVVLAWRGEWEAAEAELTAAIAESNATRPPMAVEGIVRLAELRLRQGRISDARELFAQVEHEGLAQLGRAELVMVEGDAETAVDLADRFVRRLPNDDRVERAPGLEVLARACLAAGELARAANAAAELRAIASAIGTAALQAAAHFVDGMIAAARGERQHARVALEDAVDLYAREGAPFETGRARIELGRVLAASGAAEPALREWRSALTTFEAIGAQREAAIAADLLSRTAEVSSTPALPLGLSEREVEVLRLIAAGRSNREIAAELVLSVRTVERHVSNIYAKLGATGKSARAAATAHAFRAGLISTPP
jgi:ATP/maltotriose-dependent transcriptional regulator MalT